MDRAPGLSVRLKLTLSYAGFLMLAGALLLAAVWLFLLRYVPNVRSSSTRHVTSGVFPIRSELLHVFAPRAAAVLAFLLVFGLVGGWILAGRMLAPLTRITDATRMAATGSLSHRIRLEGRRDEFRELADAFDTMLARLEAHIAEQQRFAANASHELRTPLAITQTLLDVARNDQNRETGELVDRLHAVNTRAIDLTEALLLLSRADQRSFTREPVDLSLIAEEATETLLPLAEERGLTIETSGDLTPTIGSHALLLQLSTNLVHNAIVHNLPEQGTVWVTTSAHPESAVLTVENTGEKLAPQLVATLAEPFLRGSKRIRTDHARVWASASQSSRASPKHTTERSPSPLGTKAGSVSRCNYPPRHRSLADDERPSLAQATAFRFPAATVDSFRASEASERAKLTTPRERRTEMGTIVISDNVTLDGVVQDPAGDEGFRLGGWVGLIKDRPELGKLALDEALGTDALLLGRRTYEWLAARWPSRTGELADRLNSLPKYVVSSTLEDPEWNNSTVLKGDAVDAVSKLKQELDGEIVVPASFQLVHTLMEHDLVDELRLKIFPVVLGAGERLFGETSDKKPIRLVDTQTLGDGVVALTYEAVRHAS